MIVEVRTYRVKPGLRGRFLDFFLHDAVPLQRAIGMGIIGPVIDLEDPDVFLWIRTFPSLQERDRMKTALYEGDRWRNELRDVALPMLDRYSVVLAEAAPGFMNDVASLASVRPPPSAWTPGGRGAGRPGSP